MHFIVKIFRVYLCDERILLESKLCSDFRATHSCIVLCDTFSLQKMGKKRTGFP